MKTFTAVLSAFMILATATLSEDTDKEISYKAEFIIDLFDKVEWPKDADSGNIIAFLGDSPLEAKTRELASAKKGIEVKKVSLNDDLKACKILFVSVSELKDLAKVIKKVDGSKVLTVSDNKDFARYGIMFNFYNDTSKSAVGYEVNKMVVKMAGLKTDAELIKNGKKI